MTNFKRLAGIILPMIGQYMMTQQREGEMEGEEMALREEEKAGKLEEQDFMDFLMGAMPKEQQAQFEGMSSQNVMRALQLGPTMGIDYFPQAEPEFEDTYDPNQMTALMRVFAEAGLPGLGIYQGVPEFEAEMGRIKETPSEDIRGMFGAQEDPAAGAIYDYMLQDPTLGPLIGGMEPEAGVRAGRGILPLIPEPEESNLQWRDGLWIDPSTASVYETPYYEPEQEPSGMRTDRHNNPTAMITAYAQRLGGIEGQDYTQGDPFTGSDGRTYYTARLLGDPMATSVKLFDSGAQQGMGVFSWWNGITDQQWLGKSDQEKRSYVNSIYQMEGGANTATGFRGVAVSEEEGADLSIYDVPQWFIDQTRTELGYEPASEVWPTTRESFGAGTQSQMNTEIIERWREEQGESGGADDGGEDKLDRAASTLISGYLDGSLEMSFDTLIYKLSKIYGYELSEAEVEAVRQNVGE